METSTCPTCGAGLVDRVLHDSRSHGSVSERVGVKCSNPHCDYRSEARQAPGAVR